MWVGASVHDVAQVVATSSAVGGVAVATAIVVKLTRVLLLGPLVAWIAWTEGRSAGVSQLRLVPPFVLAFVGAAALRSAGPRPLGAAAGARRREDRPARRSRSSPSGRASSLRRLFAVGGRPLVLGLSSWVIVAAVAYAGVTVVWS